MFPNGPDRYRRIPTWRQPAASAQWTGRSAFPDRFYLMFFWNGKRGLPCILRHQSQCRCLRQNILRRKSVLFRMSGCLNPTCGQPRLSIWFPKYGQGLSAVPDRCWNRWVCSLTRAGQSLQFPVKLRLRCRRRQEWSIWRERHPAAVCQGQSGWQQCVWRVPCLWKKLLYMQCSVPRIFVLTLSIFSCRVRIWMQDLQ